MALKRQNEVTLLYRHFEPSETFETAFQCQLHAGLTHARAFSRDVNRGSISKRDTGMHSLPLRIVALIYVRCLRECLLHVLTNK